MKDIPVSSYVLHLQLVTNRTICYFEVCRIIYHTQLEFLIGCKVSQEGMFWYCKWHESIILQVSAAPLERASVGLNSSPAC